jgi:hypothetical protein
MLLLRSLSLAWQCEAGRSRLGERPVCCSSVMCVNRIKRLYSLNHRRTSVKRLL